MSQNDKEKPKPKRKKNEGTKPGERKGRGKEGPGKDLVPLKDYSNEDLMEKPDEISLVMMINKLQTAEDIENFRRLPRERIEAILKDTPGYLLDTIADVLKAFLLKMNVPVAETEHLTGRVKEKKAAELFADMEKMDIQAERQNTADAKRRAERAEERANRAEKTSKAEKRADKEAARADRAEAHAEQEAENSIRSIIELCQEMDVPRTSAIRKLMEKKALPMKTPWLKRHFTGKIEPGTGIIARQQASVLIQLHTGQQPAPEQYKRKGVCTVAYAFLLELFQRR